MKLALVIAFTPDRRSGRVLGDVVPADKAIATVKEAIASGKAPDPNFPNLAAVSLADVLRQHRFQVTAAELNDYRKNFEPNTLIPSQFQPVEIGEGDQKVIINVGSDEEAKFLTQMTAAIKASIVEIARLQGVQAESARTIETLKADNTKLTSGLEAKTAEAAKAKAVVAERDAEIESLKADSAKRISDLEAQLEAAKAKKK